MPNVNKHTQHACHASSHCLGKRPSTRSSRSGIQHDAANTSAIFSPAITRTCQRRNGISSTTSEPWQRPFFGPCGPLYQIIHRTQAGTPKASPQCVVHCMLLIQRSHIKFNSRGTALEGASWSRSLPRSPPHSSSGTYPRYVRIERNLNSYIERSRTCGLWSEGKEPR